MVAHLPPSVKHLLTLRNPNSLPSPPLAKLHGVLSRTLVDAKAKRAETGWLVLATCTLLTVNRPSTVGYLYRFATSPNPNDLNSRQNVQTGHATNKAALMRESALKSTIFVGVPRVILSLTALHEALDSDVKAALRKDSHRVLTPQNVESTLLRGKMLWNSIYAPHADKLHDKLGSYHPDFISFILQSYGSVLAPMPGTTKIHADETNLDDPDQGNLSRAMGSIVGIATLRSEGRVVPQLASHVFGLLKARHIPDQNEEDAWLSSDEGTEWVIRTVDEILDVVSSDAHDQSVKTKI
ncbi:hypothetical protein M378DRAFT_185176 [Amanita muscaria Koide BX008]|uniref:Dol-P-Man:Man(5)GlcNAc(2)-PP-Dol alpha-1,3-mannosyltransferase n=1 Tax=Amanita muscaria (strain Koide BX008) TaxID=946122 RepID=A0A0C2TLX0_AMAMK|nr:hypothetical protein M378DRAFT_185176 [Amanita muscaria Koide BX008]